MDNVSLLVSLARCVGGRFFALIGDLDVRAVRGL